MSSATPSGKPEEPWKLTKCPWQVHFEALYLAGVALATVAAIVAVRYGWIPTNDHRTKTYLYAALGGLLGGWCFDAKWFYRAVAHTGLGNTVDDWKSNRFYWRLFTPFMASFVSFAVYLAGVSEVLFVKISNESGALAFSFCFILGHFSEVVQSKLANAIEHLLPGNHEKDSLSSSGIPGTGQTLSAGGIAVHCNPGGDSNPISINVGIRE